MSRHALEDGAAQWLTPDRRTWLYRIVTTLVPCLVAVGVVASEHVQVWLLLAAAILGVSGSGVAVANVSPGPRDE